MNTADALRFRLLQRAEVDTVLGWAAAEGWNPGLADAEVFYAADPLGFWGMEHDGELIGSASTVVYDGGRLGFVGLFIVRPQWRGRGYGGAFWQFFTSQLRTRLAPEGGAALDGVFTMQAYYGASGFRFTHRNLRMEGKGRPGSVDPHLQDAAAVEAQALAAYDRACFGAARPAFLAAWLQPAGGRAVAWRDGATGAIRGYGVVRPCRVGFKIGPLFADDATIADAIYTALADAAAGQPLYLDVPECHPQALALAARHGLREGFGCARMVLGHFPELPWERIYGVTSFELG